jgi:hypothetical protein
LIVECKAQTFKIDERELTQDLRDYQIWEQKVTAKIAWAEVNKNQILEQIIGERSKIIQPLQVKGVIVTHRPFYDVFAEGVETVFWHNFPEWLSKLNWSLEK